MAAFVVAVRTRHSSAPPSGTRLNIFPGSAAPTVFAAGAAFWIGYDFVPEPGEGGQAAVDPDTGFELHVDGKAATVRTEDEIERGRVVRKSAVVEFPEGLPAGWHVFAGRWYDEGVLTLTSDRSIEFVER
jgi:hypothetical protein